ncbi:MAG: hypothetical protein ACHQ5A_14865, partial [Opitutales bacterium]
GMRHPYREERGLTGFASVRAVPAFAGLYTSPTKIEAIKRFRQLDASGALKGKRILVLGPQPWFYFVTQGQPATPMLFMHFDGSPAADAYLAQHLFRGEGVEAILVTTVLPQPIYDRVAWWIGQGTRARMIRLPPEFHRAYEYQTGYTVADEIVLLLREPKKP